LAGEGKHSVNIYLALMRHVKRIVISPLQEGQSITLDSTQLKAVGFEDGDSLFPSPTSGTAGYRLIHEYFIQPDKFLFMDLQGFEQWQGRGEGTQFELRFELDKLPFALHKVGKEDFELFAAPAVNVFLHEAAPIGINPGDGRYPVRPVGDTYRRYEVYSIEKVSGVLDNTSRQIDFTSRQHSSLVRPTPPYRISRNSSLVHHGRDMFISIEASQKAEMKNLTGLAIELSCTDGKLPERLHTGDICMESDTSPCFAEFTNIKPVTRPEIRVIIFSGNCFHSAPSIFRC